MIAALHDLTLAARFATHLLALRDGRVEAFGPTRDALTPALLSKVFDVEARIVGHGSGGPMSTYLSAPGR